MNKERKKKLSDIFLKIESVKGELEDIRDAEQVDVHALSADIIHGLLYIEESYDALERACDQLNEILLFDRGY